MIPPSMEAYIHNRVGRRAAFLSGQMSLQLEIAKSEQLIGIEERYRNDLIKRAQRKRRT
jgi:hypothetical protein